ncbi:hypothetical protein GOBAR_DD23178 [Gossypium barbadense]|nr:hypothetical protein GOBAR_DD23178 [Gossypium barbadense]
MEMGGGRSRPKPHSYNQLQSSRISLNPDTLLIIKLPDPRFLLVLSRSLFLATVIITLPCIRSFLKGPSSPIFNAMEFHQSSGCISLDYWNLLWGDFVNEGSMFINNGDIDLVIEPDFHRQSSLPNDEFDFVFVSGSIDSKFVDRLVKIGGIVAMQLGDEISTGYQKQSDYIIVYLKKYHSTIVAMKKLGSKNHLLDSSAKRKLFQLTTEAKKAALSGLEDVLFEPPRKAWAKSHSYLKKINFLPDLLGDSLENYPRRVFIDVGSSNDDDDKNIVMKWFEENYPKRNQEFEVYSIEATASIDVSDWLMMNVREEDYVVMKAEAEVVEKMIERKTIGLVDELFFESLYGRLRDEGVAVHQWWE